MISIKKYIVKFLLDKKCVVLFTIFIKLIKLISKLLTLWILILNCSNLNTFDRKYFDKNQLAKDYVGLTPPAEYPGTDLSFDDQCKLAFPDFVAYKKVSK